MNLRPDLFRRLRTVTARSLVMALRIGEGKDPAESIVAKMVAALYFTTMRRVIRSQSALYGAC
jgi:hypothetical protein